ncbi:MAG: amidohydrolase/deacetylase family metallohydrolase [Bryobacteraceae bacterium]
MKYALALLVPLACLAQPYTVLLRGGHVIDPKNGLDGPADVAIAGGKIARVAPGIDPAQARKVIDVTGLYVTPGIVDIHTHVFYTTGVHGAWAGDNSIPPDTFSFRTGVTTICDAGSSGWRNFEDFRRTVIDRVQTRVLAFVNISGLGMMLNHVEQTDFDPEAVARVARKNAGVVVGVKTAHYEKPDWGSVDAAIAAGKLANLSIMVDFGFFLPERPFWQLVTERLRPGDIATHVFRGPVPWFDGEGRVLDYLRRARERGVLFDTGHGGGSLVFRNAVPATAQKFYPDAISTDLHTGSMNAGMMDMPTTMSKFLAMGMPLAEVIRRSTWNPAQAIRHPELGHLTQGAAADVAAFRLASGDFGFADASGGRLTGKQRLMCELTLKDGKVTWDWNARAAADYRELPRDYGVRPVESVVMPPR